MKAALESCVICYEALRLFERFHTIDRHVSWNSGKDTLCTFSYRM
jgi:hypothetical protein